MELDSWIDRIRDRDPTTFEDAYWGERPAGLEVVPRLVAELHRSSDSYTRGKFAELLGEMGDASVVPVLVAELVHADPGVRQWAVRALEKLVVSEGSWQLPAIDHCTQRSLARKMRPHPSTPTTSAAMAPTVILLLVAEVDRVLHQIVAQTGSIGDSTWNGNDPSRKRERRILTRVRIRLSRFRLDLCLSS